MIAVNRSENPYGISFHICLCPSARPQICSKCKRVLDEGNHVVMVSNTAGKMLYLGHEEARHCCGKTYWTFAVFHQEFQARIAVETYEGMLQASYPHGIDVDCIIPTVMPKKESKEGETCQ